MRTRLLSLLLVTLLSVPVPGILFSSDVAHASSVEEALSESSGDSKKDKPTAVNSIIQEAEKITNPLKPFKVSVKTSEGKSDYKVGEAVHFEVSVDRDCYLTLLNVKENGQTIGVLFPNIWHRSQKVEKGKTYRIPDEQSKFRFKVAGPTGREYVKAIATMRPVLEKVEKQVEKAAATDELAAYANPKQILVELKDTLSTESPREWAEATISFNVNEK